MFQGFNNFKKQLNSKLNNISSDKYDEFIFSVGKMSIKIENDDVFLDWKISQNIRTTAIEIEFVTSLVKFSLHFLNSRSRSIFIDIKSFSKEIVHENIDYYFYLGSSSKILSSDPIDNVNFVNSQLETNLFLNKNNCPNLILKKSENKIITEYTVYEGRDTKKKFNITRTILNQDMFMFIVKLISVMQDLVLVLAIINSDKTALEKIMLEFKKSQN
jgi:hypothetical protein